MQNRTKITLVTNNQNKECLSNIIPNIESNELITFVIVTNQPNKLGSMKMLKIKKIYHYVASILIIICSTLYGLGCNRGLQYDFYGYHTLGEVSTNEGGIVSMEEIQGMIELDTWYFTSGVPNNLITLKYPSNKNEKITFDCTATNGKIRWRDNEEKGYVYKLTIGPNERISWTTDYGNIEDGKKYIDIVLKKDKKIIGFAVIKIEQDGSPVNFTAKVIKNSIFPKINGKYQNITEEYITEVIEKTKNIGGKGL